MAFACCHAGKPLEAVQVLEQTLEEKDLISAHINLGLAYAILAGTTQKRGVQSYLEKAKREAEIVRDKRFAARSHCYWQRTKHADLISALGACLRRRYTPQPAPGWIGLNRADWQPTSSVTVASVHAVLKDTNRALDLLEMAAAYHERELTNLKICPFFTGLRGHPRFELLLKRIGLNS